MTEDSKHSDPLPGSGEGSDRLDSWKEIAAYLDRGVSTVQRWERDSGLPVYRRDADAITDRSRSRRPVFAYRSEIDAWWKAFSESQASGADESEEEDQRSDEALSERNKVRWGIAGAVALAAIALVIGRAGGDDEPSQTAQPQVSKVRDMDVPVFSVSPDGENVAYRFERHLWIEPLAGRTGRRKLADNLRSMIRAWSPDGRKLAVKTATDGGCQIEVIDIASGANEVPWRGDCRGSINPEVFHPDGRRLVVRQTLERRQQRMQLLNLADGSLTELFTRPMPTYGFQFSPDGRWLAYIGVLDRNGDIYVRADGGAGDEVRLTEHPAADLTPFWTDDSRRILFLSDRAEGRMDLWGMDLSPNGQASAPQHLFDLGLRGVSLDTKLVGESTIFFQRTAPTKQIYFLPVNPASGAATGDAISEFALGTSQPTWLDGGATLRYGAIGRFVDRDVETGAEQDTPIPPDVQVFIAFGGGRNSRMAFFGADQSGRKGIFVWAAGEPAPKLIHSIEAVLNPPLTWSGDEEELLFVEALRGRPQEVVTLSSDGRTRRTIAQVSRRTYPRFSPDSQQIAFTDGGCLMRAPREGGSIERVVCVPAGIYSAHSRETKPVDLGELAWSPDGNKIAWTVNNVMKKQIEIWVVDVPTGSYQMAWSAEPTYQSWPTELDWSPEGDRIVFTKNFPKRWEIWKLSNPPELDAVSD